MNRLAKYCLPALAVLSLGSIFLMVASASNSDVFEKYFSALLFANATIALSLVLLVGWLVHRLVRRWRKGDFGARMTARFALAFALVGVLPGLVVFGMSLRFISTSVDSWFDIQVERALDSGIALGREILERRKNDLQAKAQSMARGIAAVPPNLRVIELERLRELNKVSEAVLFSPRGQLLASSASNLSAIIPRLPTPSQIQVAREKGSLIEVTEDEATATMRLSVLLPVPMADIRMSRGFAWSTPASAGFFSGGVTTRSSRRLSADPQDSGAPGLEQMLQIGEALPASITENTSRVSQGYQEYQALVLGHSGLRTLYRVTLSLTFLLTTLGALACGITFASAMTEPVLQLAKGTQKVSSGRYEPIREYAGKDEINILTRSFNDMIRQLAEARTRLRRQTDDIEHARNFLELVLSNLSTGVIVVGPAMEIVRLNDGAMAILDLEEPPAGTLSAALPGFASAVADLLDESREEEGDTPEAQIVLAGAEGTPQTLLVRATGIQIDKDTAGTMLVFDDITKLLDAQRATAWGEVARRLAHEIKNPLTPIQLAAERLDFKLGQKLPPEDAEIVHRATGTIISQVHAMKRMVDDFRDYARASTKRPEAIDLNQLVDDVAALYKQGGTDIAIAADPALPPVLGDTTRLRQVIHNVVGNSVEACPQGAARIAVTTLGPANPRGTPGSVTLMIEDNGCGFPANILEKAFEPYVTTKPQGTGLGLPTVKKIVGEHGGTVTLGNRGPEQGGGARVTILLPSLAQP